MTDREYAEQLLDGTVHSLNSLIVSMSSPHPRHTRITDPTTSKYIASKEGLGLELLDLILPQVKEIEENVPIEGKKWKVFTYTSVLNGMPERIDYIGYTNQLAPDILNGEKTLTVRYDFDRPLEENGLVDFTDENDRIFATAVIDRIDKTTVESFATTDHAGHASYESVDDLLSTLSTYYPDADITASSTLTVIHYKDVEPTETGRSEYL